MALTQGPPTDAETPDLRRAQKRPFTPLGIIALFVSFSEAVVGAAAALTAGWVQSVLVIFLVVYATLVALVFFYILWKRPHVFYSPMEYGPGTDVGAFVRAIGGTTSEDKLYAQITEAVHDTLSSGSIVGELASTVSNKAGDILTRDLSTFMTDVADRAVESIRERGFITVDSRPLLGRRAGTVWQVPYGRFSTVSAFLDDLWVYLSKFGMPSMQYGILWALRDNDTGRTLLSMGRRYAKTQGGFLDDRGLGDAGILPGSRLEMVTLQHGADRWSPGKGTSNSGGLTSDPLDAGSM